MSSTPTRFQAFRHSSIISYAEPAPTDAQTVAAESYAPDTPGAHPEMHAQLAAEIALLQAYMPTAPTGEAVQALVDEIVGGLPADKRGKSATGTVMKALWERLGDARAAVDKKDVARRVGEALK